MYIYNIFMLSIKHKIGVEEKVMFSHMSKAKQRILLGMLLRFDSLYKACATMNTFCIYMNSWFLYICWF